MPASWIDELFQAHRQRQYPRELLTTILAISCVIARRTMMCSPLRAGLRPRRPGSAACVFLVICRPRVAVRMEQGEHFFSSPTFSDTMQPCRPWYVHAPALVVDADRLHKRGLVADLELSVDRPEVMPDRGRRKSQTLSYFLVGGARRSNEDVEIF